MGHAGTIAGEWKGSDEMTTSYSLKNPYGYTQTGRLTYENTEKYIEVKGVNIHYHEAGEEHEDTIVFLHGGGYGASGWSVVIRRMNSSRLIGCMA